MSTTYRIVDEETYTREFNRLVIYKTWLLREAIGVCDVAVLTGRLVRCVHMADVRFGEIDNEDWFYFNSEMTAERKRLQRNKDDYYVSFGVFRTHVQVMGGFDRMSCHKMFQTEDTTDEFRRIKNTPSLRQFFERDRTILFTLEPGVDKEAAVSYALPLYDK